MKNLRRLREGKKITMKELGQTIGVAESTISLYETGKREPDYETTKRLAAFFHVSVDYLWGCDNTGQTILTIDPIAVLFCLYSITVEKFAEISGLSRDLVDRLSVAVHPLKKKCEMDPLYDLISEEQYKRINDFFHVDLLDRNAWGECELPIAPNKEVVDKLRKQAELISPINLGLFGDTASAVTPEETVLFDLYRSLNPEGQEKLLDYADDLVQSGKYIKSDSSELGAAEG